MRVSEALRATGRAARSGARAGASATRGTGRFVDRVAGASGARSTGLSTLIELTAAGGAGDAFVAVSLAGTIFFSTSVDQARGRVVLFLLVTMAPFAVLAPFIGPFLDRMQQGRRYILGSTLLARGLLCWGMSAAVTNPVTLLPAAFGILVLQKAYGVARASVTPRLLPEQITLVAANARSQFMALVASMLAGALAAGVQSVAGSAWVLRVAMVIYLAAMFLALRLPERVDSPPAPAPAEPPHGPPQGPPPGNIRNDDGWYAPPPDAGPRGAGPGRPGGTIPLEASVEPPTSAASGGGKWRTLRNVGPVVGEAMRGNAVLRAFSGYTVFFLAFLLRTTHFGVSHNLALGALVAAAAAGGLAAMAIGSLVRARAPQAILFTMLTLAPVVTAACAWFFSFTAAIAVAFTAALAASLAKLAQDSIVQREIGEEIRSSTFGVSETLNQVANVAGALAGVLVSMLDNGQLGLAIAAAGLTAALVMLVGRRRHRILAQPVAAPPRHRIR
ncbi:MAG: MFS transporter [Streptosporangiaceae bacterium]|nr:MFS transporter [Streptosporangiaceae bacterium]